MADTSPRAILIAARALIAEPERWTQGEYGRHANGNPIGPAEPNCSCRCTIGALLAASAAAGVSEWPTMGIRVLAASVPGGGEIIDWNDAHGRTHAEVLAVFDRAIAAVGDAR